MNQEKAEHGDEYKGGLLANFSSNVWFGANHDELYACLTDKMPLIRRYPEEYNAQLKKDLGSHLGIDPSQLWLTNGTAEGIYLLAQAYGGAKSLIVSPTFSEYAKACRINRHRIFRCPAHELETALSRQQPDLVWICTPNNPDGFSFGYSYLENLVKAYPRTVFIFDVSFKEYCLQRQPENSWSEKYGNVILMYSFTKRYGIPGLRIGYLNAREPVINKVKEYAVPWTVNTLAAEALKFLLDGYHDSYDISEWLEEKAGFSRQIDQLAGFKCLESSTPFFLVKLFKGTSAELKSHLLQKGILIRDASGFFDDGSQYIRLLTLTPDRNNLLINELRQWMQN